MNVKKLLLILTLGFLVASCGPARFVAPLAKNENAVAVDLGGPIVTIPGVATMPIPFTSITYGRGITNDLTIHGSWHTTAAIFGVAQIEAGATYGFWKNDDGKHGLSGMLGFNTAMDFFENNFKFWPQLDVHYYWKYQSREMIQDDLLTGGKPVSNVFYTGIGSWYELEGRRAHNEKQTTIVIPMLNIGHDLNWKKWTFKTEIKLIAPFTSNKDIVMDYFSLTGKTGATGVYIGFIRKF